MTITDHLNTVMRPTDPENAKDLMKRIFFAGAAAVVHEIKNGIRANNHQIVLDSIISMDKELKEYAIEIAMKAVLGECPPPIEPYMSR